MHFGFKTTILFIVLWPVFIFSNVSQGAQSREINKLFSLSLEELFLIKVTAEHRVEQLQEVPLAITSFSGDALQVASAWNFDDLQYKVPGLNYSFIGGTNNAQLTLRGVGSENPSTGGDPGVTIYSDGVYLQSTNFANHQLYDVERIEVLRGPQGTLYGRNAIGGAINIINKQPTNDFSFNTRLTVAQYNNQRFQGMVNGPIIKKNVLGRVSVSADIRDSYFENVSTASDKVDVKSLEQLAMRGQLKVVLTDNMDLTVRTSLLRNKNVVPPNILLTDYPANYNTSSVNPSLENKYHFTGNGPINSTTTATGGSMEFTGAFGDVIVTSISGYRNNQIDNAFDIDNSDVLDSYFIFESGSETYSQELRVASKKSFPVEWISGLYFFRENGLMNVNATIDMAGNPIPFLIKDATVETTSYSVFGQTTWYALENVGLTLGLRYTYDEKKAYEPTAAPAFGLDTTLIGEKSWNKPTGKIAIEYSPSKKVLTYLSVSTGYKAGGFNIGGQHAPYSPETVVAYEGGAKGVMFHNRLKLNVAAFVYDYQDQQVFQRDSVQTVMNNAASTLSKGAEIEIVVKPIASLECNGSIGWLNTEFKNFKTTDPLDTTMTLQDLSGNALSGSPEWNIHGEVQYQWLLGSAGAVTLHGDISWVADQYYRHFNLESDKQSSYRIINAGLYWYSFNKQWSIHAWSKNLEDVVIIQDINRGHDNLHQATIAAPRTFGLTAGYNF
ncbi:MAG: TonB-dependent receptor [Fibrobacterales bacterium]